MKKRSIISVVIGTCLLVLFFASGAALKTGHFINNSIIRISEFLRHEVTLPEPDVLRGTEKFLQAVRDYREPEPEPTAEPVFCPRSVREHRMPHTSACDSF